MDPHQALVLGRHRYNFIIHPPPTPNTKPNTQAIHAVRDSTDISFISFCRLLGRKRSMRVIMAEMCGKLEAGRPEGNSQVVVSLDTKLKASASGSDAHAKAHVHFVKHMQPFPYFPRHNKHQCLESSFFFLYSVFPIPDS